MTKYTQDALINLLEKKGLIDKKKFCEEIKRLRGELPEAWKSKKGSVVE